MVAIIRKTAIILFLWLVVCDVSAFPFFTRSRADRLFESRQYYAAIQAYTNDLTNGRRINPVEIWKKIGFCYLRINRPQEALPWLQQVAEGGYADADVWYNYGLVLQQIGDYTSAITAFENCLQMQPGHHLASVKIESCRFAMAHSNVNPFIGFRAATELNTAGGEFGASLYDNIVYYSSAASPFQGARIDQRTGLQHVRTNMARIHNRRLIFPQIADETLPNFITDGLFSYDSIANVVYFTYCDPNNNRCGLYASQFAGGRWAEPELILQNRRGAINGHPAVANAGTRLYFTSTMTGGMGETDIWFMDKSDNGEWGTPVNAGSAVNTFGREEFPFVYADTLLFFASDGHVGFGGFDIFCSTIRGNTFSTPVNLLRPFNSPGDDFNLIVTDRLGLLSSSRNEILSDDIYYFEGLPSFWFLSGHVTDDISGSPINNARLTVTVDGVSTQQTVSDSTGYYGFFLRSNESPMLYVRSLGYRPSLIDMNITRAGQFANFERNIQIQQSIVLPATIHLYNKNTGNPISERAIICYNNDGETQILRTDASGAFSLIIQEDQREYWIRFPDGNFLTESITLTDDEKSYSMAMQPIDGDLFEGWLQFKSGSAEAIEMSQALIPRIAAVIKANQGMVFQIEGFFDTEFEAFQPSLAIQRAEYVVRRLVDNGADIRQLSASSGTNDENDDETDDESTTNQRRVEIRIIN